MTSPSAVPAPLFIRVVAGVIVFFLVDAAQLLLLVPDRSGELFAWPIAPDLTAYVLAAAYVAGGYFFVRVALGAPWEAVAAGFVPVTVFVWIVAGATALHLDRFREDSLPFAAWALLYAAAPIGIPVLTALAVRSVGPGRGGPRLTPALRVAMGAAGAVAMVAALVVFATPATVIGDWPWQLTPLNARIVAAVIGLFGSVGVSVALDGRRAAATVVLDSLAIGLGVLLVAALAGSEDVDWDRPLAPALLVVVAAAMVATVAVRVALARGGATREVLMR